MGRSDVKKFVLSKKVLYSKIVWLLLLNGGVFGAALLGVIDLPELLLLGFVVLLPIGFIIFDDQWRLSMIFVVWDTEIESRLLGKTLCTVRCNGIVHYRYVQEYRNFITHRMRQYILISESAIPDFAGKYVPTKYDARTQILLRYDEETEPYLRGWLTSEHWICSGGIPPEKLPQRRESRPVGRRMKYEELRRLRREGKVRRSSKRSWHNLYAILVFLILAAVVFAIFPNENNPNPEWLLWLGKVFFWGIGLWLFLLLKPVYRYTVQDAGVLTMYTVMGREQSAVRLDRELWYEILFLREARVEGSEYIILSETEFPSYRGRGYDSLWTVCKEMDEIGTQLILSYDKETRAMIRADWREIA